MIPSKTNAAVGQLAQSTATDGAFMNFEVSENKCHLLNNIYRVLKKYGDAPNNSHHGMAWRHGMKAPQLDKYAPNILSAGDDDDDDDMYDGDDLIDNVKFNLMGSFSRPGSWLVF